MVLSSRVLFGSVINKYRVAFHSVLSDINCAFDRSKQRSALVRERRELRARVGLLRKEREKIPYTSTAGACNTWRIREPAVLHRARRYNTHVWIYVDERVVRLRARARVCNLVCAEKGFIIIIIIFFRRRADVSAGVESHTVVVVVTGHGQRSQNESVYARCNTRTRAHAERVTGTRLSGDGRPAKITKVSLRRTRTSETVFGENRIVRARKTFCADNFRTGRDRCRPYDR